MKIAIVSDKQSWLNHYIPAFVKTLKRGQHSITWIHKVADIPAGEIVFYLGCGQLVPRPILERNKHNLVVHESALPKGKGWSPLTWQILEGITEIPVTLFEAEEEIDSGVIYLQEVIPLKGTELIGELRKSQAETSIRLCLAFLNKFPDIVSRGLVQHGEATYYPRRRPEDSRLDPDKTISEQFNLLRVVDNDHYPAFFNLFGETYIIKIEKKK